MFNKIYLVLLAISLLVMSVLIYIANSWLSSIGKPEDALVNFDFYSGVGWQFLWISSLVLLLFANIILWTKKSVWAFWTTFVFFAVFILLQTWWLSENLSFFNEQKGFAKSGYIFNGITGAFLCLIVGIGVFFNQFIVFRLHEKMFNKQPEATESKEDTGIENSKPEE